MAFLGGASHIKREHGEDELARIVADAGPATQKTFSKKINGLSLQPYESFIGLLRSADRHLGSGDLAFCQKLGDLAARYDLRTIFKGYAVRPAPGDMIRACTPIWGMYTEDAGQMIAVDTSPENTLLRIEGFPAMDPAHCRLMEGWMTAAMDFIGVRVLPGACERMCAARGAPFHEFWCRWEAKGPPPAEPDAPATPGDSGARSIPPAD
jgi:hypothetical protein